MPSGAGSINAQGESAAIEQRWRDNLSELRPLCGRIDSGSARRIRIADRAPGRRIHLGPCAPVHAPHRSKDASSTATAICSPTISSGWTGHRRCSTAWSSTTNFATWTASMTRPSSRWISSSSDAKTSPGLLPRTLRRTLGGFGAVVAAGVLHRLSRRGQGEGRLRSPVAGQVARPPRTRPGTSPSRPSTWKAVRSAWRSSVEIPGTGKSTVARALAEQRWCAGDLDRRRAPGAAGHRAPSAGIRASWMRDCTARTMSTAVYEVGPAPGAPVVERWAIGDPGRHLAGSGNAGAGSPPCRGNTFGDGRTHVLGDGRHGRRPNHDEAAG